MQWPKTAGAKTKLLDTSDRRRSPARVACRDSQHGPLTHIQQLQWNTTHVVGLFRFGFLQPHFSFCMFICASMASRIHLASIPCCSCLFLLPHTWEVETERLTLSDIRGCLTAFSCVTGVLTFSLLVKNLCALSIGIGVLYFCFFAFLITCIRFSSSPILSRLGGNPFLILFFFFHLVFSSWDFPRRQHPFHDLSMCTVSSCVPSDFSLPHGHSR